MNIAKINFKQEDFNTLGIIALIFLVLYLFRKRKSNNQTVIQPQETNPALEEPVNQYILNIPKKPVNFKNSLNIVCPQIK